MNDVITVDPNNKRAFTVTTSSDSAYNVDDLNAQKSLLLQRIDVQTSNNADELAAKIAPIKDEIASIDALLASAAAAGVDTTPPPPPAPVVIAPPA
jgi:uncharacterized small protein (DUF1192 family)